MLTLACRSLSKALLPLALSACLTSAGLAAPISVHEVAQPPVLHPLAMQTGGRMLLTRASNAVEFGGEQYTSQWPGSYFRAAFRGRDVYFRVGKAHEILHIRVDGQKIATLVKPSPGVYEVDGLSDAHHIVGVYVATESQAAPNTFDGFAIPALEKALRLPRPKRQIEFIGDSYTVGYGNLSPTRACTTQQVWARTDDTQAFGPLVARHYHAAYQVDAISGRGVVRNYNGFAADTVPEAYPYTLFNKQQRYENPAWKPQVIVVGLGTNDFTTKLHAGEPWKTRDALHADYEATYAKFLKKLRARDPHALVIVWAADVANGEVATEASKVVDHLQGQGDKNLVFVEIRGLQFHACNSHPTLQDDKTIAQRLIEIIDAHPGVWRR
uniref:GDSL family lipase n=1 Tax=Acidobacterium capsulatum TaxID=33075 RepID=A0A7V4XSN4_9BACT